MTTSWPSQWEDMTSHARLLWAKWAAMSAGGPDIDLSKHYQMPV